jgi:hypothetical protein
MKSLFLLLFGFAFLGCSQPEQIALKDVQPKRVFKLDRPTVFEAVKFFAIREQFRLDSFEEETGRVIGHKVLEGRSGDRNRTIIMNLRVLKVEENVTEVNARFTYYQAPGVLQKSEEGELVDCFIMLFDTIGQREK